MENKDAEKKGERKIPDLREFSNSTKLNNIPIFRVPEEEKEKWAEGLY